MIEINAASGSKGAKIAAESGKGFFEGKIDNQISVVFPQSCGRDNANLSNIGR